MENNPNPLPIQNVREVKTYSLVCFNICDSIASDQTFLVDKQNRKIWMFQMRHPAQDVTSRIQRRYLTDRNKSLLKRRISYELYLLMDNQDEKLYFTKVLQHSESAKEITEKLYEVRTLHAELQLKICKNHGHWATEEAAAEHFKDI